jgi:hypothetical protein
MLERRLAARRGASAALCAGESHGRPSIIVVVGSSALAVVVAGAKLAAGRSESRGT